MNSKIKNKEYGSIIFFISEALFLTNGFREILEISLNDAIISSLIGGIISTILLLVLPIKKISKKDILFIIPVFIYFIYLIYSQNAYIKNKYLVNTSSILIIFFSLLPVLFIVKNGIKTISKVSYILFIITIIEIIFIFFNLFFKIDFNNIKPILNTSYKNIILGSFKYIIYFITPSLLLLKTNLNVKKELIIFSSFSNIIIIIIFFLLISIFGIDLSRIFIYPSYSLMKKINYFHFIEHVENILTTNSIFSLFLSEAISLNYIKDVITYFFYN